MSNNIKGSGGGGGGSAPDPYIPVEEENSVGANTRVKTLDFLCAGQIVGPAIDGNWYKSTYFNETPVMNDDDSMNFEGVVIDGRIGTDSQAHIPMFDSINTIVDVNTAVTYGSPITKTVTDDEVDDVVITIELPRMVSIEEDGDRRAIDVKLQISVTPDNGAGSKQTVGMIEKTHKNTSPYRFTFRISDISDYGIAPWQIEVDRWTEDSTSDSIHNSTTWYNYITQKRHKYSYPSTALLGCDFDIKQFGNSLPARVIDTKGMLLTTPSNYDADARTYTGIWDGSFISQYSTNGAWFVYTLLTDAVNGLGIDSDNIDVAELYAISQRNDGTVSYTKRYMDSDGVYQEDSYDEPRHTFNYPLTSREDALQVLDTIAATFNTKIIYSNVDNVYDSQITFIQDRPKDVTTIFNAANVINGKFTYASTDDITLFTEVSVTWYDHDDFNKPKVTTVETEDQTLYDTVGHNETNIVAVGCTSEAEARRRGRYYLYTNENEALTLTFTTDLSGLLVKLGEIIAVQDYHYAGLRMGGLCHNATSTSIQIDEAIDIEAGKTYTLSIPTTNSGVHDVTLTNGIGSTDTLTWTGAIEVVPDNWPWAVKSSTLATTKWRVVKVEENTDYTFVITCTKYDENKFNYIDGLDIVEVPPTTALPSGKLSAPTNMTVEAFCYDEGDQKNKKFGLSTSWEHSTDPRTEYYEVQYKTSTTPYRPAGNAFDNYYEIKDLRAGNYDVRTRARNITMRSNWLTYSDFSLAATTSGVLPPTGLQVKGGGTVWGGADMEIEWTTSSGVVFEAFSAGDSNIKGYQVEIRKTDDTLLRTATTGKYEGFYTYTKANNEDDTSGDPQRSLKVNVYTIDVYDNLSDTAATDVFSNTAPDQSAATPTLSERPRSIHVSWNPLSDIDMDYYKVYYDTSSPPTADYIIVNHPVDSTEVFDLSYGTSYYFQVEPWDEFGAGTKSQVAGGTPTQIPIEDVNTELIESVSLTDSEGATTSGLAALYDTINDSGGATYSGSGWGWVQVDIAIENFIDGLHVWNPQATDTYVSYSSDGVSWNYLSGNASHGLDTVGGQERLTSRSTEGAAQTNYWTTTSGHNYAFFPNGVTTKYCRLHFDLDSGPVTLYELVFDRIIIAEKIVASFISAISANIGIITAGVLMSSDYSATEGMIIDLDNKDIEIRYGGADRFIYDGATGNLNITGTVTFQSASSGYANITDKPANLSAINATEGTALSQTSNWRHSSDNTRIDGGDIYTNTVTATHINGGAFGTLTITSGKLNINVANGIEVNSATGIKINTGGDITFSNNGSNYGKIQFTYTSGDDAGSIYGYQSQIIIEGHKSATNPSSLIIGGSHAAGKMAYISGYADQYISWSVTSSTGGNPQSLLTQDGDNLLLRFDNTGFWHSWEANAYKISSHKAADLGTSGSAWDDVYADDFQNVADLPWLDEIIEDGKVKPIDDLKVICSMKPSSEVNQRTGMRIVNDSTLPLWLVTKYKEDNEVFDDNGDRIAFNKKGDVAYGPDGRPYYSINTMMGLVLGAIRQLNGKIGGKNRER